MAISDELTRIQTAKADIKASIEAKGVTVPSDALIDTYDTYIGQISGGATKDYIIEGTEYDPTATYTGAFIPIREIVSADIPSGFTSISNNAFSSFWKLTSVTIPSSVTSIGSNAFAACSVLTSVTIPSSVTSIGSYAFWGCTFLPSITIPDGVTSIEDSVFENCNSLPSITIPDGVTSIGGSAFRSCPKLRSITIPDGVTSIGNYAFFRCTSLTSVTCLATTPPTLGTQVFDNTNNCPIYVPSESVAAYKTASGWSSYASRIQAIPSE